MTGGERGDSEYGKWCKSFRGMRLDNRVVDYESVLRYNPSIERAVRLTEKRNSFMRIRKGCYPKRSKSYAV